MIYYLMPLVFVWSTVAGAYDNLYPVHWKESENKEAHALYQSFENHVDKHRSLVQKECLRDEKKISDEIINIHAYIDLYTDIHMCEVSFQLYKLHMNTEEPMSCDFVKSAHEAFKKKVSYKSQSCLKSFEESLKDELMTFKRSIASESHK